MSAANARAQKPEHQLINMILPVLCGFIGTLCFGIFCGNTERYHWMLPMVMTDLQQYGFVSSNVIATSYAIECFPDLAPSIVIVTGAYRNIVGFGASYGVVEFVTNAGFEGCFGTYAGISGILGLAGIPFT